MAKLLGIDIGGESVRAILVRSSYRKLAVEGIGECEIEAAPSLADAIAQAVAQLSTHPQHDSIAVSLDGNRIFVRSLKLPKTAAKQLAEVLPFELEANLPIEIEEVVYDYALTGRSPDGQLEILAVAARTEDVRERIELVRTAVSAEAEKVAAGGFPLAALSVVIPELREAGTIGVLDIAETRSELAILRNGEAVFVRTLDRGTHAFPDGAPALVRDIRQSLAAFRVAGGEAPVRIYLTGLGASAEGAIAYLQSELGIEIVELPTPQLEPMPEERLAALPRFAKALGLALSLLPRSKTLNLRKGPLAYERGYAFLRDKIPVLSGLAVVIVGSFFFSAWAELKSLDRERDTLQEALALLSKDVLGEETRDPDRAMELLSRGPAAADEDPMPYVDAFDVMVQLSKAVPESITHDVEELDVQRGKVTIHGIVPTIPDAQEVANGLRNFRCFQDVKIVRTNQVVGDSRQKYVLELELKCPSDKKDEKKSGESSEGGTP